MLRKIIQTGKTDRGELRWPGDRKEFHQASRHSAAVADAHYVIPQAVPKRARLDDAGTALTQAPTTTSTNVPTPTPEVIEIADEDERSIGSTETNSGRKRRRMAWTTDCFTWFAEHLSDPIYLGRNGFHDWERMAVDMNLECGSVMSGQNLKDRWKNQRKEEAKKAAMAAVV